MSLKPFGPFLKPYRVYCILGPAAKLAEAVLELYLPLLMARVIDEGVGKNDTGYVLRMGGIMLGIVTVGLLCALVCQYVASVTSQGFGTGLRNAVFAKIGTLSHAELDRFGTPSLINRVTGDVNQLQYAVAMLIRLVIRAPFLCIGGIIMAMTIDLKLSLVIIVAIPLFVVVITLVMRKTIKLHRQVQKKLDRLTLVLRENLSGVRVIRAFARTGEEQGRFDEATDDHTRTAIRVGRLSAMLNPATQLIMNAAILAIVWFGGWRVEAGGMTTGEIIAFINYVNQILLALTVVANLVITFTKAYASAGRVLEVLETEPSIEDGSCGADTLPAPKGQVEFRHVDFKYQAGGTGENVLTDIDFTVRPGEFLAVVGGTGTGKSSLVNLIPRFYDVTDGAVLVDGVDVRDYPLDELRARIGMVLQNNVLFTGTIRENLLWGRPDATEEEMIQAAKNAQAYDFVMALPDGFDTQMSQGGTNVSGGQKQRLCIARAMLRHPAILILDDSTSAVDTATDAKIRQSFKENLAGTTVIIIAQRISSVQSADRILVLDDGHISDIGTHDELMARNEIYQEIYQSQQEGVQE